MALVSVTYSLDVVLETFFSQMGPNTARFILRISRDQTPIPLPPNANFAPDPTGPTFLQALKEQLGLKLEPGTGTVEVIVIDRVEQPSEN
jgi:uncharacterized protein (TIGR03435 family)